MAQGQNYCHQVKDNEVDYLLATLALGITIPFGHAAKALTLRKPFDRM